MKIWKCKGAFCCPVSLTKHPETLGGISEKIYMKKPYDKAIATDISTTVSDPEIKNAVRMTKI